MTLCHLPRTHSPAGADEPDEHEASLFDQLCAASIQGGAVLVPAGELERIEHLCRYVTRPPIATQRLALAPDGRRMADTAAHRLVHGRAGPQGRPGTSEALAAHPSTQAGA